MRTHFKSLRSDPGRSPRWLVRRSRQRGVSLFIILVILLLALIIVLSALAVSNLNESLVGNQSDAQRSYSAAEALLEAAQRDIRLNGRYCTGALGQTGANNTIVIGQTLSCTTRYPTDGDANKADYMQILSSGSMVGAINTCAPVANTAFRGVCISDSPINAAFLTDTVDQSGGAEQWSNGATYTMGGDSSDFASGVNVGSAFTSLNSNGNDRGRYWVEIFPYNIMSIGMGGAAGIAVPDGTYPYVFRITAMAKGLRGTTLSVMRTYYVPYPL